MSEIGFGDVRNKMVGSLQNWSDRLWIKNEKTVWSVVGHEERD